MIGGFKGHSPAIRRAAIKEIIMPSIMYDEIWEELVVPVCCRYTTPHYASSGTSAPNCDIRQTCSIYVHQ